MGHFAILMVIIVIQIFLKSYCDIEHAVNENVCHWSFMGKIDKKKK